LSYEKIDLNKITTRKGKRHCVSMKIRYESLRSRSLEHLEKCWLGVVRMTKNLMGEDVRTFPTDDNRHPT